MADTSIGKAYVQIVPTAKGISKDIESAIGGDVSKSGSSAGKSFASQMVGAIKGVAIAAGIGKIFSEAINAGADLQQSFGGLETIYGDAAAAAKDYAYQAAQAGISANDYAEQAVSFGASLKQAFEGDTTKAVEAANTAIMDMTDNAAKMGTPIENIQNAYQGFAKQNYTMLDNLKLGYGGTKEEMERLLADASKLSGVEYNIDNLGDVYDAIHVIQEDLGLTGVAAQEASETFSGSFGAMQAAAQNLLADIALGADIGPDIEALGQSVSTFVTGNLLPMISNVIKQIPSIIAQIPGFVADLLPDLIAGAVDLLANLAQAIVENIPTFISGIGELITAIPEALTSIDWGSVGSSLLEGLSSAMSDIWDSVTDLFKVTFGIELPDWGTVTQNLSDLWEQVKSRISDFFKAAFDIITDDKTITEKISALWELVKEGIRDYWKAVFEVVLPAVESIVGKISDWWGDNIWPSIQDFFKATFGIELPDWGKLVEPIRQGWDTIKEGISGFFKAVFKVGMPSIEDIISSIDTVWKGVWDGITGFFEVLFNVEIPSWGDIKESVVSLWNDFSAGIVDFFKTTFKITMPSWESVKSTIKSGWDTIKDSVGSILSGIFSLEFPDLSGVIKGLKEWWGKIVEGIGDFFTLDWGLNDESYKESMKTLGQQIADARKGEKYEVKGDQVTIDSSAIKKALEEADLKLGDIDTSSLDTAETAVTTSITKMTTAFKNMSLALPSVKAEALATVKTAVDSAITSLKGKMKFSWNLPTLHGHLPVISVNMKTAHSSDGKTSVDYPSLNVSGFKWFAKGGIFDGPSLIGVGEAGPEAVVPLDKLWKQIDHSIDKHSGNGVEVVNYIEVNGARDPEEWAIEFGRTLQQQFRMNG